MSVRETNRLQNAASKLKDILCSVKSAIVVLLLIGIVSIVGTLVPQGDEYEKYMEFYGPLIASILSKTGLTNIFGSWWFLLLVGYIAVSMIVCSIRRLRSVLQTERNRSVLLEESDYEQTPYHQSLVLSDDTGLCVDGLRDKVIEVFKKRRYRVVGSISRENLHCISVEKGFIGILGPFLVHISIIIIIIGGVWTAAGSFSHFLNIEVGQSVAIPKTSYSVHLNDFIIEYYKETDRPKEYISILSVTENSRVIGKGELKVNTPLTIERLHFYQMRYTPTVADVTIAVKAKDNGKKVVEFTLPIPMAEGRYIEQIGVTVKPSDFLPDFARTTDKVDVSRSGNFNNPAVLLDISSEEKPPVSKWVFFDPPKLYISTVDGYVYELKDFTRKTFSGVRVVYDRAIPIVYAGFFVVILGTFLSCYVFHRRVWVMIKSSQGQIKLRVAGQSNRNVLDFQREIGTCLRQILPPIQENSI